MDDEKKPQKETPTAKAIRQHHQARRDQRLTRLDDRAANQVQLQKGERHTAEYMLERVGRRLFLFRPRTQRNIHRIVLPRAWLNGELLPDDCVRVRITIEPL